MTEIIVSANKSINLKKSENSYYGESLADIFKLLIPYHINGILAENADISFCFATPAGNLEKNFAEWLWLCGNKIKKLSYFLFSSK